MESRKYIFQIYHWRGISGLLFDWMEQQPFTVVFVSVTGGVVLGKRYGYTTMVVGLGLAGFAVQGSW